MISDQDVVERLARIDRNRIAAGFDRTGEIDADIVWMRDRIYELRAAVAAAEERGDHAARLDIWEALMQPGARDEARRNGFTGREGSVWAVGYVAGKLEASRIAIGDDDEWKRLAEERAQQEGRG